MNPDKVSIAVTVATLLITLAVGGLAMQNVDEDALEYTNKADEWCDAHNGTLHNAQVLGPHGGLHCELPNGTTVHMDAVIQVNSSA